MENTFNVLITPNIKKLILIDVIFIENGLNLKLTQIFAL